MKKKCIIINGNFAYTLKVDGQEINFQEAHNADYFESHYKELGYEVERVDTSEYVQLERVHAG